MAQDGGAVMTQVWHSTLTYRWEPEGVITSGSTTYTTLVMLSRFVVPEQVDEYIQDGWVEGKYRYVTVPGMPPVSLMTKVHITPPDSAERGA